MTGADTGIGRAIARRLLEEGWALAYATRRRDTGARETYESLAACGTVHWVAGDLADPEVPARLVAEAREALGSVDALVNNAGITVSLPALAGTAEDFDRIFAIDVRAAFLLARAAASGMLERGGAIVNVTSVHERVPRPGFALYAAAKAALGMLSRGLALELAPFGVRVNSVAPGVIRTERVTAADVAADRVPAGTRGDAGGGRGAGRLPAVRRGRLHDGGEPGDRRRAAAGRGAAARERRGSRMSPGAAGRARAPAAAANPRSPPLPVFGAVRVAATPGGRRGAGRSGAWARRGRRPARADGAGDADAAGARGACPRPTPRRSLSPAAGGRRGPPPSPRRPGRSRRCPPTPWRRPARRRWPRGA